jgi:predicted 3-demethylubiquinone-9 3-methyltransferase (glyoxalase superfamily)
MSQKITPFLWFADKAEEAINFYVATFNNSPAKRSEAKVVAIKKYPDNVDDEHMKGMSGKVLTGVFELEGQRFMALDGGPLFTPNESVSFLVECADQAEIDYFWDTLTSNGGQESQCGWLKDKYGFSWQIAPNNMDQWIASPDTEASARAMQAMLKMKKIVIADLEAAAKQ